MNSADNLREEMAQQQAAVRRTCGCWLWLLVVAVQVDQPPQQATTSHHSLWQSTVQSDVRKLKMEGLSKTAGHFVGRGTFLADKTIVGVGD